MRVGLKTDTTLPVRPIKRKPILLVRRVGKDFEYYIQQGNKKLHFIFDQELHDDLKQAIQLAEMVIERREVPHGAILLQLAGSGQKS